LFDFVYGTMAGGQRTTVTCDELCQFLPRGRLGLYQMMTSVELCTKYDSLPTKALPEIDCLTRGRAICVQWLSLLCTENCPGGCLNGGTCVGSAICRCTAEFEGPNCQHR